MKTRLSALMKRVSQNPEGKQAVKGKDHDVARKDRLLWFHLRGPHGTGRVAEPQADRCLRRAGEAGGHGVTANEHGIPSGGDEMF